MNEHCRISIGLIIILNSNSKKIFLYSDLKLFYEFLYYKANCICKKTSEDAHALFLATPKTSELIIQFCCNWKQCGIFWRGRNSLVPEDGTVWKQIAIIFSRNSFSNKGFGTLRKKNLEEEGKDRLNKAQSIKYFNIIFISMESFHINNSTK